MRNLLIAWILMLFAAGATFAQRAPKTEFFAGYEYEHLNPGGSGCHGLGLNLAYNLNDWLGGVGDFGMTLGGGMDYKYNDRFSLRVIQVEYLYTHFGGAQQNNARIEAGLLYTW